MRAVLMHAFGDEGVLRVEEVDAPRPGPGEVAVRVGAVGVSRTRDVATRSGNHPYSRQMVLPHILGGDFAGTVAEVGAGVGASLVGARVAGSAAQTCGECEPCTSGDPDGCLHLSILGIHRRGAYAEVAVVRADAVNRIPDGIPIAEAAAMGADGPLALTQLEVAGVGPGTSFLVTGATGALGATLLALADHLGAQTIATSRRPAEIPADLGATRLDAAGPELTAALLAATDGRGVQAVADNVANPEVFSRYFPALAMKARLVFSGAIGTPELPVLPVPARDLYVKSISLLGVRTARVGDAARFWALVDEGFRLPRGIVHEFPLEQVGEAHARIAAETHLGHTVLLV